LWKVGASGFARSLCQSPYAAAGAGGLGVMGVDVFNDALYRSLFPLTACPSAPTALLAVLCPLQAAHGRPVPDDLR